MPTYTAVVVVPNELDQDYVIEQLERLGVVAFCGPGSLVQSFPPDYPWQGTRTAQYRQIGDAVPPALARACLAHLLR